MITQIQTKELISVDLFNLSNKQTIYCKIDNFIQDGDGYTINGKYYWLDSNTETILKQFHRVFNNTQLDNLFNSLSVVYPDNSSYTEKRIYELKLGLKYIITIEPVFGLLGSDWE